MAMQQRGINIEENNGTQIVGQTLIQEKQQQQQQQQFIDDQFFEQFPKITKIVIFWIN